MTENALA